MSDVGNSHRKWTNANSYNGGSADITPFDASPQIQILLYYILFDAPPRTTGPITTVCAQNSFKCIHTANKNV